MFRWFTDRFSREPITDVVKAAVDSALEQRAASLTADLEGVTNAFHDSISMGRPSVLQVAAVEIAAGTISRALMAAQVEGATIPPAMLEMIGRQLCYRGNSYSRIELDGAEPVLVPAFEAEVQGGVLPDTWRYTLSFARPSDEGNERPERRNLPYEGVVHIRYGAEPSAPWRGIPALARGSVTAEQLAYIDDRLRAYAKLPAGGLIAAPDGVSKTAVDSAENALRLGQGGLTILESLEQRYSAAQPGGRSGEWEQILFGPNPPATAIALRDGDVRLLLAQMGVPPALFDGAGAGLREAYRQLLTQTLTSFASVIEWELSAKYNREVRLTFPEIALGDIAARARAFGTFAQAFEPFGVLEMLRLPTDTLELSEEFEEPPGGGNGGANGNDATDANN